MVLALASSTEVEKVRVKDGMLLMVEVHRWDSPCRVKEINIPHGWVVPNVLAKHLMGLIMKPQSE